MAPISTCRAKPSRGDTSSPPAVTIATLGAHGVLARTCSHAAPEGTTAMPGAKMIRELRASALSDAAIAEALMRELELSDDEARDALSAYDARAAEVADAERRRGH
jgi:hypothetical protein